MDNKEPALCQWCQEQLYVKRERVFAPILQAATPEYAALDRLPFEFVPLDCNYCPVCGRKLKENEEGKHG